MHETIAPLQLGLSVAGSFGIVGALLAAGEVLGRRTRRTREQTVIVTDNDAEGRFEIRVDGEFAGFADYELADGTVAFRHTEINPSFRGRGLAGTLIASALDASRRAGLTVEPYCPYVRTFSEKNKEYNNLLAPPNGRSGEAEGCCALPS